MCVMGCRCLSAEAMAGMKKLLHWSATEDDDDDENLMEIPLTALRDRRRAVDSSDLRQCAIVHAMIKSSKASSSFATHRYVNAVVTSKIKLK